MARLNRRECNYLRTFSHRESRVRDIEESTHPLTAKPSVRGKIQIIALSTIRRVIARLIVNCSSSLLRYHRNQRFGHFL